jgi:riboflavin synthase
LFTGIIEEVGIVFSLSGSRLTVSAEKVLQRMKLGDSIAVNGVCLTVTDYDLKSFSVDIMPETRERTNLGLLASSDEVNLETPLTLSSYLGGHLVQGHVDDTALVNAIYGEGGALIIRFEVVADIMRYIVEKGFITVDGISLTVVKRNATSFWVSIVDFTRQHTNLRNRQIGDRVNIEVDIIAKYVEQLSQPSSDGLTISFLGEHGFIKN